MSGYSGDWLLCGGWAVDAWLGRVTRSHVDLDIMVFDDQQALAYQQLSECDMVAHDAVEPGPTTNLWTGWKLAMPAHVHARPPEADSPNGLLRWVTPPYKELPDDRNLELIINERAAGRWLLDAESGISLPWTECVANSAWGIPIAVPEVLLFYKATAYWGAKREKARPHDKVDFEALAPLLADERRRWLADAIGTMVPDHPWLPQLI